MDNNPLSFFSSHSGDRPVAGAFHNEKDAPPVAAMVHGLCRLLESTRTLCHQSLYCQWMAEEPDYKGLGSLFQQHYQSLRKASDILADHIRTLGYALPSHLSQSTWGTDKNDMRSPAEMIGQLIRGHQICALEARNVMQLADAAGDYGTSHMVEQRLCIHDRAVWLLMALPKAKPTRSAV